MAIPVVATAYNPSQTPVENYVLALASEEYRVTALGPG